MMLLLIWHCILYYANFISFGMGSITHYIFWFNNYILYQQKNNFMKALVKQSPEVGIWMEDVPVPKCGTNDVMIKITHTAICGTDLHIYKWDDWAQRTLDLPLVTGHEFCGSQ